MKRLTAKEEEAMALFWEKGPLFVKEMLAFYADPKPHFNTLSTVVRGLEEKGFVSHKTFGNTYQYYATVTRDDYRRGTYNPQIQFSPKSETKRPKIELPHKTKRSENHKRTTPKMQPEKGCIFSIYK